MGARHSSMRNVLETPLCGSRCRFLSLFFWERACRGCARTVSAGERMRCQSSGACKCCQHKMACIRRVAAAQFASCVWCPLRRQEPVRRRPATSAIPDAFTAAKLQQLMQMVFVATPPLYEYCMHCMRCMHCTCMCCIQEVIKVVEERGHGCPVASVCLRMSLYALCMSLSQHLMAWSPCDLQQAGTQ